MLAFSERSNRGLTDAAVSLGQTSHFRSWHETVMPVLSPQVRYEDINGPSSVAVRGHRLQQVLLNNRRRVEVSFWRRWNLRYIKVRRYWAVIF